MGHVEGDPDEFNVTFARGAADGDTRVRLDHRERRKEIFVPFFSRLVWLVEKWRLLHFHLNA
jgi:hypothetical protein